METLSTDEIFSLLGAVFMLPFSILVYILFAKVGAE